MDLKSIAEAVAETGLSLRGAFHPEKEDGVPALTAGGPAGTLVLLGTVGSSLWPSFSASTEYRDGVPDPLDRWSRRTIGDLACRLDATALFPFGGPPHLPFVRWAKRADDVHESPLGILVHPEHGLWHAYRGALALSEILTLPPRIGRPRPCDSCGPRPCLDACPVAAFGPAGYDVQACSGYIAGPLGDTCLGAGCQARRACPVGKKARYEPAQAQFHMAAFQAARRESSRE